MAWVVQLEEVIDGKVVSWSKIAALNRPGKLESLDDRGLRLANTKPLLEKMQSEIVIHQIQQDVETQEQCPECKNRRQLKGYRPRHFRTLFSSIPVRVPCFVCPTLNRLRAKCLSCTDQYVGCHNIGIPGILRDSTCILVGLLE